MAITIPHIEESNRTTYLPPKGEYETFADESHYEEKVREWGLSTTKEVKKQFWYKEKDHQRLVTIKGYEVYGKASECNTLIIEFQDGNLSCIHPAYLKEMQAASFGKASLSDAGDSSQSQVQEITKKDPSKEAKKAAEPKEPAQKKEKKEKPSKLELPEEKVHFTATVKQFALSWNNFNEENDEVVVLENVVVHQENPIEVGLAWCAHSKTLKKFELVPGEALEFDGKIVKKKLPKGKDVETEFIVEDPVLYKVNNPSKIKKS
ncbi:hypothetical protein BGM26_05775 [Bacillus sp. FJAT-29790]|uniref:hypothetical protein n=1 Tax=Bacillus sp. FJAT-29790 TaxID=1895002 RepID=UPI001C236121|nr:hypothetical protein [Bacillus sp. FJAT-29790]MBU8878497.1 hypothetical protein [Bacillus sp. FJAT-29790]